MAEHGPKRPQDGPEMAPRLTPKPLETLGKTPFWLIQCILNPRWPLGGPRTPKMVPGWPQDGPKVAQGGPKMAPRWPQDCQRRQQKPLNNIRKNIILALGLHLEPKMAQEGPKLTRDSPKMAQDGPKIAQDGPKVAPTGPEEGPRWPQDKS